jgi:putative ABC transport system permease protein
MFNNNLKIALRNLLKQKGLATINILSLSMGLATFSLFLLYAVNEFSYDRIHADADRIYRVYRWTADTDGQGDEGDPYLPMPLGPALKAELPDVEEFVRWKGAWGESFIRVDGKVSRMSVSHADPSVFKVFSFPMKFGLAETALSDPRSLVLTEEVALQLFGESNPTGKTLEIKVEDNFEPFTVSAVAENMPPNSSLGFQIMGSFEYYAGTKHGQNSVDKWTRSFLPTFVRLREGSGLPTNHTALANFRKKYYPEEESEMRKEGLWKEGEEAPIGYRLQPLRTMHTDTQVLGGEVPAIEPKNIWMLLAIAAGVLLIACINFTTLAIGRSAGRAKEVGVRKVLGGDRLQLTGQFLAEALVLAVLSGAIGLLLAQLLMPLFNQMADRELVFSLKTYPELGWMILALTLLTGLVAGSYPALVLSGFKPVEALKSKIRLGGSNFLTKTLVAGQFVISIGLIVSTLIVLQQLDFMRSKNPGFTKENVVVVDASDADTKTIFPRFKQAAKAIPQVKGVSGAELGLGEGAGWSRSGWDDASGNHREVHEYFVDDNYLEVLGLRLVAGRNFDPAIALDTVSSVVINETMMREFGWTPETAIGQPLTGYYEGLEKPLPVVVGVVNDFHFRPLKEEVKPQMFHQFADYAPFKFFVSLEAGDPKPVLASLKIAWESSEPLLPFKYSFLNEDIDRFYQSEARFGTIIAWAGGTSIFLACLGLLGLAGLAAVNRTKEIGIRKVLGATTARLVGLLSKDFMSLVIMSLVIASPLAYFFMNKWLQDFAYHIDIQWSVFLLAGAMAVAVAFLTVSFQSIKAALANPVESLRSE